MSAYVRVKLPPDDSENTEFWEEPTQKYDIISEFSSICARKNINDLKEFRRTNKIFLNKYDIQFSEFLKKKIPTEDDWNIFRKRRTEDILRRLYIKYNNDDNELLFFASALFEKEELQKIKNRHIVDKKIFFNQIRNTDTAIIFALKYGNIENEKFLTTMKFLVEECNIDTKIFDQKGKTSIDYIAELYKNYQNVQHHLVELAKILIDKGSYDILSEDTKNFLRENDIDFENKMQEMDEKNKLFYWISTNSFENFCNFRISKKMVLNSDNGENTLLQYAVRKLRLKIVQNLLEKGADPNRITLFEIRTPLELSIVYNNKRIFEELLKKSKTKVTQPQFNKMVANLLAIPRIPLKTEMFELLLQWDRLEIGLVHDVTGNTPLHFAVIFSNRKSIEGLLSRGASLLVKNKAGKAVIDIIDSADLEKFFDSCLNVKTVKSNVTDVFYKVQLDFLGSLVDKEKLDEFYIVSKLSKNKNFKNLLKHPLVYTFISLKWTKMKIYFWLMLLIQFFLLLSLSTCLWLPPIPAFFIGLFNMAAKFVILPKLKQAPVHVTLEISLIVLHIFGLFMHQVCAFLFILMSICFLITTGYHPKLSKWSIMLQTVFKTFTLLLIFASLVLFSFSIGFFVLFSNDGGKEDKFRNISTSFFKTYIMTAGELSLDEITFDTSGFSGYLILVLFTLYVPLVIVNFWTAVAVTDVEKIEKEAEINAINNIVLFMQFVDHIYDKIGWHHCQKCLCSEFSHIISFFKRNYQEGVAFFKNLISKFSFSVILVALKPQKPFLFLSEKDTTRYYDGKKCKVVSYIDGKDQLAQLDKSEDVTEIDEDCLNRIKNYIINRKENV